MHDPLSPAVRPDIDLDDDDLPVEDGAGSSDSVTCGRHHVRIPAEGAGDRLDKALADALGGAGLSRSRLKSLIDQGLVATGGQTINDASHRVKPGQDYVVTVPESVPALPVPQPIPLDILYEDAELLVIDKPAGMVVHPAAGNADGTLVNALLAHCGARLSGIGGVRRPGIVHRLDKDTSGLMVVAKTDKAHRSLSRTYQALVWGGPAAREGTVETWIGRHPTDRKRMAVLPQGGKPAITDYRVRRAYGQGPALSVVECRLRTGRTHQIRVHMAHIGCPLVGDPLYGRVRSPKTKAVPEPARGALVGFARQALHAEALEFTHPATGERMRFTSPLPNDIRQLADILESM